MARLARAVAVGVPHARQFILASDTERMVTLIFSDKWNIGNYAQIRADLGADFTKIRVGSAKFDAEVERLIGVLRTHAGELSPAPE